MINKIPQIKISSETHLLSADFITPAAIYQRVRHLHSESFLLESVQQNESIGRYSIIGIKPLISFQSTADESLLNVDGRITRLEGNPFDLLKMLHASVSFDQPYDPDFDFTLTWIGYIGYDMIRHIEDIPDANPAGYDAPDCILALPSTILVVDHVKQLLNLMLLSIEGGVKSIGNGGHYENLHRCIISCIEDPTDMLSLKLVRSNNVEPDDFQSNVTKEDYIDTVVKAKEHIMAGDAFQVVLSQRFVADYDGDFFRIYRALRRINPSPYMYCLAFENFQIIGSSPEMLVKLQGRKVTISPIAGTRPRGRTPEEEERLKQELLSDEKELAEHRMLIDLARNDIGRVCKPGTVKPEKLLSVENYSHVKHIVSHVVGELEEGYDAIDLLKAVFPAGTLSGTPKIRAMEIIDDLEKARRGIYGGAIILWDFMGYLNSCIIIRSMLLQKGRAYIQAGAGIVSDSIPNAEHQECINKASAVIAAIKQAKEQR